MVKNTNKEIVNNFMQKFLKWNDILRFSMVISIVWLSVLSKKQADEIHSLTIANSYLLAQSLADSKAINETPWVWWKKEYNPKDESIIMRTYNTAFYEYILKPLNLDRYYYVRKSDFELFPYEDAKRFYDEDLELVKEFLAQGDKIIMRHYNKSWENLDGKINKAGYWRWVVEEDGLINIYGKLDEPIYK